MCHCRVELNERNEHSGFVIFVRPEKKELPTCLYPFVLSISLFFFSFTSLSFPSPLFPFLHLSFLSFTSLSFPYLFSPFLPFFGFSFFFSMSLYPYLALPFPKLRNSGIGPICLFGVWNDCPSTAFAFSFLPVHLRKRQPRYSLRSSHPLTKRERPILFLECQFEVDILDSSIHCFPFAPGGNAFREREISDVRVPLVLIHVSGIDGIPRRRIR